MSDEQRQTSHYLTEYFIDQALKRGKGVSQFLGWFEHDGQKAIRYALIYKRHDGFLLWVQEMYDQGTENGYGDIGEYVSICDDDALIQHTFATLEETLDFAATNYGARRERWVNESMISDEYCDVFANRPT